MIDYGFLEPGVKAIVHCEGGEYVYNGFVPSVRFHGNYADLSILKMVKAADENRYYDIKRHVRERCQAAKEMGGPRG